MQSILPSSATECCHLRRSPRVCKSHPRRRRAVGLGRCPVRARGSKVRFADNTLSTIFKCLRVTYRKHRDSLYNLAPMPLIAGFQLDFYEIIALLGAGGMAEVYRARDAALKRDVAIKVLPAEWSRDTERLRRFELEAQAAAALNHPNIVSIFHVGQYDGSPYIVTELLQGETLRHRLSRGPMRLHEVLDFGEATARGLAAAHDAGIGHRDLKPGNLFISKDGRAKILDFVLSTLTHAQGP